eukprot:2637878-Prymnesium_polylepis.2
MHRRVGRCPRKARIVGFHRASQHAAKHECGAHEHVFEFVRLAMLAAAGARRPACLQPAHGSSVARFRPDCLPMVVSKLHAGNPDGLRLQCGCARSSCLPNMLRP